MPTDPPAELLVVDRKAWAGGNVRTLQLLLGEVQLSGAEAKVLAYEAGALVGVLSRAVLAQFDPFRDQLLVVYPNLRDMGEGDGLRWIVLHEVTHLAQFRAAPWIPDHIVSVGRGVVAAQSKGMGRQIAAQAREKLPDLIRWARAVLEGRAPSGEMPLLDLLPPEQRQAVQHLHGLVTVLEGHATHVTESIGKRVVSDYDGLQERIRARGRRRSPLVRLLEAVSGLEMKRRQYEVGRDFCAAVWEQGGAGALAPVWTGPDAVPTPDELREPELWLKRVA